MNIDKFGPPEPRNGDIDFDIYFRLNKSEGDRISDSATQIAVAGALTAAGGPYGAAAALLIKNYITQIASNIGPNGSSVKMTVRNGLRGVMQMSYFIAEPI